MFSVVCTLFERIFGKLNFSFSFHAFLLLFKVNLNARQELYLFDSKNEEKIHTELYLSSILEVKQFVLKL